MVYRRCAVLCLVVSILIPALVQAQTDAGEAAAEVRALVRALDPHTAYRVGMESIRQFPDSAQLRAWWLVAGARAGREAESLEAARAFADSQPDEGWAWFALADAQLQSFDLRLDSIDTSSRAVELLGPTEDALWLHLQALYMNGRGQAVLDALDQQVAGEPPGSLLAWRAMAEVTLARQDPAFRDRALETSNLAVELDPDNVDVLVTVASGLGWAGAPDKATELLTRAEALAPRSIRVREAVWGGLRGRDDLSSAEKVAIVLEDVDELLSIHGRVPSVLYTAQRQLDGSDAQEQATAMADEILRDYPDSREAEGVLVSRYRALRQQLWPTRPAPGEPVPDPDLEVLAAYRQALYDFLSRPRFYRPTFIGEAYQALFHMSDYGDRPADEELLNIVDGMVDHATLNARTTYAEGAIALAERTTYYDRAEEVAKAGFPAAERELERFLALYSTQAERDQARDYLFAVMHDALGWVYFQSERVDEAETELRKAYELYPDSFTNLHHLGQLYEHKGDRASAERFYVLGMNVDTPAVNPNRESLEYIYRRENGSMDGFDDYLAEIAAEDAVARREEILATRLDTLRPTPEFDLETLDGERLTTDDLRGRITVINYWGIWCYWCLIEMDQVEQLHKQYEDDPDVLILTINNDDDLEEVVAWMAEKGYSFPVLRDDGYVRANGVSAFPTTWFIDAEGRIVYAKEGWSQEVAQEFGWRIEAIRESQRP